MENKRQQYIGCVPDIYLEPKVNFQNEHTWRNTPVIYTFITVKNVTYHRMFSCNNKSGEVLSGNG
ncbi:hypothetical protein K1T71_008910 [Dendrolimus kikuchii]|uniref:Uncharacterized protein n=1 Tax=Dendrolimus kikuchii TaxID=765133 RepID=A0ACC1CVX5_9NEOP|nr:hypothetical protein K1T71_008910 [Dendrolimus kikuchii]